MTSKFALAFAAAVAAGSVARSQVTFYSDASTFNAAHPGLAQQSFNSADLYGQAFVTQANDLTSATNDAVFTAGSILPGLTIETANPGQQSSALEVYAGGPAGATSIGNDWFGDSLIFLFAPGVSAVGENVFANASSGTSYAGPITETVYSNGTHHSDTMTEAAGGELFFGASATAGITEIKLSWGGDNDASVFASGLEFGPVAATSAPDGSAPSLVILAGLLLAHAWPRRVVTAGA